MCYYKLHGPKDEGTTFLQEVSTHFELTWHNITKELNLQHKHLFTKWSHADTIVVVI
jgi:hypothetical protein